jgi:hypothetical protein
MCRRPISIARRGAKWLLAGTVDAAAAANFVIFTVNRCSLTELDLSPSEEYNLFFLFCTLKSSSSCAAGAASDGLFLAMLCCSMVFSSLWVSV